MSDDFSCFGHFHHKSRLPLGDIVTGPQPAKKIITQGERGPFSWYKGANLTKKLNDGHLSHDRGFSGHIGPGNEPEVAILIEIEIMRNKFFLNKMFYKGMKTSLDFYNLVIL